MTIKELCIVNNVNYKAYLAFLSRYKLHHTEKLVQLYVRYITIRDNLNKSGLLCPKINTICKRLDENEIEQYIIFIHNLCENNLKFENIERYKNNHNITDYSIALFEYIKYLKEKNIKSNLNELLERNNISVNQFYYYRNLDKYKDKTDNELIEIIKGLISFLEFCSKNGIKYDIALKIRKEHPEYSDKDIIDAVKNYECKPSTNYAGSFKEKCDKLGINYNNARAFKRKHKGYSNDEIIRLYVEYLNNDIISFAEKCKRANINVETARSYKQRNPGLTDEQIIMHYRPDCYINWLGELVIPT